MAFFNKPKKEFTKEMIDNAPDETADDEPDLTDVVLPPQRTRKQETLNREEEDIVGKLRRLEQENKDLKRYPKGVPKRIIKVVKELPLQPVREYTDEDGNIVELITIEESLEKILNG